MTIEARRVSFSRPTRTVGSCHAEAAVSSAAVSVATCRPSRCQCFLTVAGSDLVRRSAGEAARRVVASDGGVVWRRLLGSFSAQTYTRTISSNYC